MRRADQLWLGVFIGFLIPLVILLVVYFEEKIATSFWTFIGDMFTNRLLAAFLRIGLMGNLALFLLAFYTGFNKLPKGILASTILYGLFIVYMYIW